MLQADSTELQQEHNSKKKKKKIIHFDFITSHLFVIFFCFQIQTGFNLIEIT